jgi:A/G-specific adenine glycosylase
VDSNVCRVIGRVYDLDFKGEARRSRKLKEITDELVPIGHAKEFNWAIINLSSAVCVPRKPPCSNCPLNGMYKFAHTAVTN